MRAPCVLAAFVLLLASAPALAYKETDHLDSSLSTHQFLMDQLPGILDHDGHPELAARLRGGWLDDLKQGSIESDRYPWRQGNHYMDPQTHEGLAGFSAAGDLADAQVALARAAWAAGDADGALLHLGWAMEVVQDLTVPHHARLDPLDGHDAYEAWVLAHQTEMPVATSGVYDLTADAEGHHGNTSRAFDWVDDAAHASWGLFPLVDGTDGAPGIDYRAVAAQMVPLAESLSAGFLDRMVEGMNAPPVANAGPDVRARIGSWATLDGSGSTDDVGIRAYTWDLPTGTRGGATVDVYLSTPGTFTATLTVTDAYGVNGTAATRVTALPIPTIVLPASVTARVGAPTTILAAASDGETPASVSWFGPTWRASGNPLVRTFNATGETTVSVVAVLSDGFEIDGEVLVRVVEAPPEARIVAPTAATAGRPVAFDARGSWDAAPITAYWWSFGDGTTGEGPTADHVYASPGTYVVALEIEDARGGLARTTAVVRVAAPPAATASETPVAALFLALAALFALAGPALHRHEQGRGRT